MSRTLNNPAHPLVLLRQGLLERKRTYQSLSNVAIDKVVAAQVAAFEGPKEAWHVAPPLNSPRHVKIKWLLEVCETCTMIAFKAKYGVTLR